MIATKTYAQISDTTALFRSISRMDSLLFNAVNTCDTNEYKKFFTADLEFYHDKGGVSSFATELASIQQRCKRGIHVRRVLVPNSLTVYSIKDYGAIQEARHTFYFKEPNKPEQLGGTFKFIHIWKFEGGIWKISRVVSYGH
ncbi:MAG TPA: nuclear transport factor 2 family protein [Pseudosphingobacterium sp.]|nr:nuclear transport factor 2 family protein [Pseudosphingobacterium sp.]